MREHSAISSVSSRSLHLSLAAMVMVHCMIATVNYGCLFFSSVCFSISLMYQRKTSLSFFCQPRPMPLNHCNTSSSNSTLTRVVGFLSSFLMSGTGATNASHERSVWDRIVHSVKRVNDLLNQSLNDLFTNSLNDSFNDVYFLRPVTRR